MQPGLGDGTLKWEPNVIVGLWDHSCAMTSGQLDVKPDKSNKIWSNHRPSPLPSYPRPDQGKKSAGGQGIYILCIFRRRRKQRRVWKEGRIASLFCRSNHSSSAIAVIYEDGRAPLKEFNLNGFLKKSSLKMPKLFCWIKNWRGSNGARRFEMNNPFVYNEF